MAKERQRSNREPKKPKAPKTPVAAPQRSFVENAAKPQPPRSSDATSDLATKAAKRQSIRIAACCDRRFPAQHQPFDVPRGTRWRTLVRPNSGKPR